MKMKTKYLLSVYLFILQTGVSFSQVSYVLNFHPCYDKVALKLDNSFYKLGSGDSIQIDQLKFYVSGIEFLNNDKIVWKEKKSFHLLDAYQRRLTVSLKTPPNLAFDKVKFNVGIDSTTNVSGALGGDLDPTKAMYWNWQNGYINFKLEGRSNLCKTRNNEFVFHLGGYQYPFGTLQTVILPAATKQKTDIVIDVNKIITGINLSEKNLIMSPCNEAVLLSEKLSKAFSLQAK